MAAGASAAASAEASATSSAMTSARYPNTMIQRLFEQKIGRHSYLVDGKGQVQRVESNINPSEGNLLYSLITRHSTPVLRTLEVGCAGGTSALYITQALRDRHSRNRGSELRDAPTDEPRSKTEIDTAAFPKESVSHSVGSETKTLVVSTPEESSVAEARGLRERGVLHISIDPYQTSPHVGVPENEKGWDGLGIFNVYQAGNLPMMSLIEKKSHFALPEILAQYGEGSFDLVFIDGMHLYDYTLVDAFYGTMLLREGGLLVIDDIRHPSVKEVSWYLDDNYGSFMNRRKDSPVKTMGVWEKTSADKRNWSFHCSVCKTPHRIEEWVRTAGRKKDDRGDRRQTRRRGQGDRRGQRGRPRGSEDASWRR